MFLKKLIPLYAQYKRDLRGFVVALALSGTGFAIQQTFRTVVGPWRDHDLLVGVYHLQQRQVANDSLLALRVSKLEYQIAILDERVSNLRSNLDKWYSRTGTDPIDRKRPFFEPKTEDQLLTTK